MRWLLVLSALPLLAGAESHPGRQREIKRYRLEVHVPDQAGIYFSAWAEGDAIADHDGSDGQTVTYRRRFVWYDGCTWESRETIKPTAPRRYDYAYRETILSCPPGAVGRPGDTTPRDGYVLVFPTKPDKRLTPLFGWARDWDKSR